MRLRLRLRALCHMVMRRGRLWPLWPVRVCGMAGQHLLETAALEISAALVQALEPGLSDSNTIPLHRLNTAFQLRIRGCQLVGKKHRHVRATASIYHGGVLLAPVRRDATRRAVLMCIAAP